jgi:hypothetical protein
MGLTGNWLFEKINYDHWVLGHVMPPKLRHADHTRRQVMADEKILENFEEVLSDDAKHLDGILYLVRREAIEYAVQGIEIRDGEIQFGNPRWVRDASGRMVARGFDSQSMTDLRTSIQRDGLETPLRLRVTDENKLECVNGERRLRSIDRLVKEGERCWNAKAEEWQNPEDVFEWIYCQISRMDEQDAVKYSLVQETGSSIGDYAAVNVVRALREVGLSDEEIRGIVNRSVTWMRETDQILDLDNKSLDALMTEQINRKVALRLSKIDELDARLDRLSRIQQNAVERICEQQEIVRQHIEEDEADFEIASGVVELAELEDDEETVAEANEKMQDAENRLSKHQIQAEKLASEPPTATIKDWDATRDDNDDAKPFTASKIEKYWLRPLLSIIHRKGKDDKGEDLGINLDDAQLFRRICEALLQGKREADGKTPLHPLKILKAHSK